MDVIFPQKWWITWIWKLKIKWSFIKSVQTSDWFHCFSFVNHIPGYINMQPSFFSIMFDESLIMISTHFQINLSNKSIEIKKTIIFMYFTESSNRFTTCQWRKQPCMGTRQCLRCFISMGLGTGLQKNSWFGWRQGQSIWIGTGKFAIVGIKDERPNLLCALKYWISLRSDCSEHWILNVMSQLVKNRIYDTICSLSTSSIHTLHAACRG